MSIKDEIKKTIETNDTCLFMKGTPDSPQCGFSMAVSNLLKHLNVNFKGIKTEVFKFLKNSISSNKFSITPKQ